MLRVGVLVSGGGTNLQAILDAIDAGTIRNAKVEVVISNNAGAFALERAKKHGIPAECLSPKDFASREEFNEALVAKIDSYELDLIVLAGYLVKIPAAMIEKYRDKIINIHPSLIPSFCGVGFYGLKVHEAALRRGVKITGATVHFVDEEWIPVRSSYRRLLKWKKVTRRRSFSAASWNRQSGRSCRRPST